MSELFALNLEKMEGVRSIVPRTYNHRTTVNFFCETRCETVINIKRSLYIYIYLAIERQNAKCGFIRVHVNKFVKYVSYVYSQLIIRVD